MTEEIAMLVLEAASNLPVGQIPQWIRILPLGQVPLTDQREPLQVDAASVAAMVAGFQSRGIDLVIDYEHQSLAGERAPAAGWIKELEGRVDGLWGRVEWTRQAQEYLSNREYRYFSPVLRLDPETRSPTALLHLGLTNIPAIVNLPALVAKYEALGDAQAAQEARAKKYGIGIKEGGNVTKPGAFASVPDEQWADPVNYRYPMPDAAHAQNALSRWGDESNRAQYSPEERSTIENRIRRRAKALGIQTSAQKEATAMLEKLKAKLGMKPEASEEEVLALVDQRAQEAVALQNMTADLVKELALPAETTPAQLKGAILALKQGQDHLTGLQQEVAALKESQAKEQAQQAVTEALKAGKLQPTQQEWALAYAARDPEGFKAFIDKAPRLVPVGQELKMVPEGGKGAAGLTPAETTICRQMGIKSEDFKVTKEQLAQAAP